jgi:hypothetical protein
MKEKYIVNGEKIATTISKMKRMDEMDAFYRD